MILKCVRVVNISVKNFPYVVSHLQK